jgi:hypothetical protein
MGADLTAAGLAAALFAAAGAFAGAGVPGTGAVGRGANGFHIWARPGATEATSAKALAPIRIARALVRIPSYSAESPMGLAARCGDFAARRRDQLNVQYFPSCSSPSRISRLPA